MGNGTVDKMSSRKSSQPMQSVASELEGKTLRYWNLSRSWNGAADSKILSFGDALNVTRDLVCTLSNDRALRNSVIGIENEIIKNTRRKKAPKAPPNNLLPLRRQA